MGTIYPFYSIARASAPHVLREINYWSPTELGHPVEEISFHAGVQSILVLEPLSRLVLPIPICLCFSKEEIQILLRFLFFWNEEIPLNVCDFNGFEKKALAFLSHENDPYAAASFLLKEDYLSFQWVFLGRVMLDKPDMKYKYVENFLASVPTDFDAYFKTDFTERTFYSKAALLKKIILESGLSWERCTVLATENKFVTSTIFNGVLIDLSRLNQLIGQFLQEHGDEIDQYSEHSHILKVV